MDPERRKELKQRLREKREEARGGSNFKKGESREKPLDFRGGLESAILNNPSLANDPSALQFAMQMMSSMGGGGGSSALEAMKESILSSISSLSSEEKTTKVEGPLIEEVMEGRDTAKEGSEPFTDEEDEEAPPP